MQNNAHFESHFEWGYCHNLDCATLKCNEKSFKKVKLFNLTVVDSTSPVSQSQEGVWIVRLLLLHLLTQ